MEAEFRPRPPSVPPYASSVNHIEPLASEITPETDPEAPIEEISIDQAPLFELSIDAPPAIHEAAADSPVIESLTAADPVLETAQESFTIPSQLDTLPDPGPPGDLDDTVTTFQVEPRVEAPSQPRKTDPQPERRKRERNPGRPARVQSSKTHTAAGLVSRPGGPEASIAAASVTDRPKSRAVNPADDWPSAQDILSTCSGRKPRVVPRGPRRSRRGKPELVPTVENEPGQWKVPLWLVWPPLAIATLLVGGLTCYLSWAWVADSYAAMLIAERLAPVDPMARRTALPDSLAPPSGSWTRTTAQHLAHWALYLEGAQRGKDAPPPDIQGLLVTAVQVSPINATARLARARLESGRSEAAAASGLGLSRDPLSLALSGRQLLARGKRDRALALFAQALQIGSRTEFTKVGAPRFSGDPDIPRFLLPGEDRLREILGSLGDTNDWTADDWLAIVPTRTLVPIAAARLLRERGRKEVADALLDRMLAESTLGDGGGSGQALWLASRAEALALLARWQDADQVYRQAIELLDETDIQRSWWFNLADIDSHLPDSSRRQLALRATQTASNSDEISRRAGEMLRAVYARPGLRSNGTKAN
jgi:tetratricopeptide (TPR) repeat protein